MKPFELLLAAIFMLASLSVMAQQSPLSSADETMDKLRKTDKALEAERRKAKDLKQKQKTLNVYCGIICH